jgi:hypothetical protein
MPSDLSLSLLRLNHHPQDALGRTLMQLAHFELQILILRPRTLRAWSCKTKAGTMIR